MGPLNGWCQEICWKSGTGKQEPWMEAADWEGRGKFVAPIRQIMFPTSCPISHNYLIFTETSGNDKVFTIRVLFHKRFVLKIIFQFSLQFSLKNKLLHTKQLLIHKIFVRPFFSLLILFRVHMFKCRPLPTLGAKLLTISQL